MNLGRNLSQGRVKSPGLSLIQAFRDLGDKGWLFILFLTRLIDRSIKRVKTVFQLAEKS